MKHFSWEAQCVPIAKYMTNSTTLFIPTVSTVASIVTSMTNVPKWIKFCSCCNAPSFSLLAVSPDKNRPNVYKSCPKMVTLENF